MLNRPSKSTWTLGLLFLTCSGLCAQKMLWRKLPSKTWLSASDGSVIAYDSKRNVILRFGGNAWVGLYEYDGITWKSRSLTMEPSLREGHGGAYDAKRGKFVIFGGVDKKKTKLNDTWEFDGRTWTPRIFLPKSPPAGRGRLVYDSNRGLCVWTSFSNPMQTWEYDGKTWAQKSTKTTPDSTDRFGVAYDSNRKVVVLYGGDTKTSASASTWEYDGLDWKRIATKGSAGQRIWHDLAYDAKRKRVVLCGGHRYTGGYYPDYRTYEYDGKTWIAADLQAPYNDGKYGLSMCYDSKRQHVISAGHGNPYEYMPFPGTWTSYGKGCGTTPPVLAPDVGASPKIGTNYPLSLTTLPSAAKGSILALGASKTKWLTLSLPLDLKIFGMPGCMLQQSMDVLWLMSASGSTFKTQIPFPNVPALAGQSVFVQSIVIVPGAKTSWLNTTNGGAIVIGN